MDISQAALALRVLRRLGARAGERALVVGTGPLGGVVCDVLRSAGVETDAMEALPSSAALAGVALLIETTGDPVTITALLETAPPRARLALVASSAGRLADVDFYRTVHQRGLELIGLSEAVQASPEETRAAEALLRGRATSEGSAVR